MTVLNKKISSLKYLSDLETNEYLNSKYKVFELILCIASFLTVSYTITSFMPVQYKGIISQIQSFTAIYLTFRFGRIGFTTAILLNIHDIVYYFVKFLIDPNSFEYITGVAARVFCIISAIVVYILFSKQQAQKKRLERLAITDELTDAYNQRFFHLTLEDEIEKSKNNESIGLIMLDIDNFKMYNDIYGHECGDNILKGTASILKAIIYQSGYICRYGGDEFAVILPKTDLQNLETVANIIRENFELQKDKYYPEDLYDKVTLSMGLSEYPNIANSKDELMSQADLALYHAKNLGKDKVHLYQDVILQIRKNISSDHQQLIGIFKGLLSTISAKDKYTLGHCERVSSYAMMIGEALDLGLKDISTLQYAGLLHDIGKIEMPKSILNKLENLTEEESNFIRQHPIYSENILEPLEGMDQLIDYVRHHHERYDGKGYPDSLSGDAISLGARILCVADSFDAMISDRPYSKSLSIPEALRELEKCAGTQFDPLIVRVFTKILKTKVA